MWAKIENNIVVNIIQATTEFVSTLDGHYVFSEDAKIGYGYDSDSATFYSLTAPFNGAVFDSETFTWGYPTSPGEGYYWSNFSGAWIVDSRPPSPYNPFRPNNFVWFEDLDSTNGEWKMQLDQYTGFRIVEDTRKAKKEKYYRDTNEIYYNKLATYWETSISDSDLVILRDSRIVLESLADSDWRSGIPITINALDSEWIV